MTLLPPSFLSKRRISMSEKKRDNRKAAWQGGGSIGEMGKKKLAA
ncbi:hypothetical protein [Paenibacillus sp. NEAU-GSW1]|nr:hypothetical protein [Paenibacillus sp. NEAU-GSW1]